jgi:predicted RNase H-like HicB family nuclease
MKNIELTAIFEPADEGGYIAYIEEIAGINSQGETLEEAKENLADAINLMFEDTRQNFKKTFVPKRKTIRQTFSLTL